MILIIYKIINMKKCTKCNNEKPLSDYYKVKDKFYSSCKQCKRQERVLRYKPNQLSIFDIEKIGVIIILFV